jgi:hypothetical protein
MSAWVPLLSLRSTESGLVPWILALNAKVKVALALAAGLLLFVAIRHANAPAPAPAPAVEASPVLADEETHEVARPLWPERTATELAPRATLVPPRAAPAAQPSAVQDPCTVAPADLARPGPPGTIEGFVRRRDTGGRGGIAWLRRSPDTTSLSTPCTSGDAADADARVTFGGDGAFRFEDVAPGAYCVGVEVENGVARVRTCDVVEGVPTPRLFFAAGSGEVRGRASDRDGAPIAGELVVLDRRDARWWPEGEVATTRTSAEGVFRFPARCGGRYFVSLHIGGKEPEADDVFGFELAQGETKKVEFGSGRGRTPWTAKVLGPDGWPLGVVPELTLENLETGLLQGVQRAGEGKVSAEVLPGRYAVLALLLDERKRIAEIRIPSREVESEIRVPPTSVLVRISVRDPARRPPMLMVSLRARGSAHGAFGLPDAGGWRFFGVPPGEYEVRAVTSPVPSARSAGDFETLVVRPGDRELSIAIEAGGR